MTPTRDPLDRPADQPADRPAVGADVVVVGGGFAGVGCARKLAHTGLRVVLIDRHDYHQFQPLLYQVATAELAAGDVGTPLRAIFRGDDNVDVRQAEVVGVDPETRTVTAADGTTFTGDHLVLAVGAQPHFFRTPGADRHAFPLYSLRDAQRLRERVLEVFDDADRDPALVDDGALTFVVVGAGATGVEVAGALADLVNTVMPGEYRDLAVADSRIYLVDHGPAVLAAFSREAHDYTARVLHRDGVRLKLGVSVKEITATAVTLSDGEKIPTRCVVWAGGLKAAPLVASTGLPCGRGGRVDVLPDLTVDGFPGVYVLGDAANIPDHDGGPLPQLGSVALQSGQWAARNILADRAGEARRGFHYHDKGIMAMISRGAAVAELGAKRHELHGTIAFATWLGVHAWLMSGVRGRVDAFVSWGWDYLSKERPPGLIDRTDTPRIDWHDDGPQKQLDLS